MLTLTEASKLIQNPLQRGVVEIFPRTSAVLERLPFMDVAGNAYAWSQEQTLPGIGFRGYNDTYTESTGVINPMTEALRIFGGISKVDRAQVKTQGNINDIRATHDAMKAKAAALEFTRIFFKGDAEADTLAFDGLEKRLTGSQVLAAGTAAGGAALTLDMLDQLMDAVQGGPDVLFMNKTMRRKVNALMRASNQATEPIADAFGRPIYAYAGVPIGVIEQDKGGNEILAFDEKDAQATPAAAACTSIYAMRFGAQEWVSGLQATGGMEVIDQGLQGIFYQTLIEWICSITVFHPKAAARLMAIKNA